MGCLLNMEKELLQRYVEGNVSPEEVETVVEWLDSDEANVLEFMSLHKLYDISVLNKPAMDKVAAKKKLNIPYRKAVFEVLKIAAVLLLFWFGMQFFVAKEEVQQTETIACQTLYVPQGQRAELILSDGTKVWLNAKTKLIYPTHFEKGNRIVTLDGEAYFDVTHNDKQPFIVKTEKMDIKVLGTEFNVLAYSGEKEPEIALLKGSIELNLGATGSKYKMSPNEDVKLSNNKLYVSQISHYDYFMWKEGILSFTNESVESIISKLQIYYDIKIVVEKRNLLRLSYTGKFRTDDGVEQVLKVLQLEHKFTYTRDTGKNIITIK